MATITREPIGPLHEKISVAIDKTDYLPSFEKTLKDYSKKASLPGFRPGKVPAGMIKKMHGPALFMEQVLQQTDKNLFDYLEKEKIDFMGQPLPLSTSGLEKLDLNNPGVYQFDFEIGLKPEIVLPNLSTAEIKAYNIEITDEMVTQEIEKARNRFGSNLPKEEITGGKDDLNLTVAAIGSDDDTPANHVTWAVDNFSEETQKTLIGKKPGDTITINLKKDIADDYRQSAARQLGLNDETPETSEKSFRMTIEEISEHQPAEMNEHFFQQADPSGKVKSEEDLKKLVYDELFNFWAGESRKQIHHQAYHVLLDQTPVELPEAFLTNWLVSQSRNSAKAEDQIKQEMPEVLKTMKWSLITDKITKDNNIAISKDDIRAFAEHQLISAFGVNTNALADQEMWIQGYLDRLMSDEKYVEENYFRVKEGKVFEWVENQIKPTSTPISTEDFTAILNSHSHH